MRFRLELLDDYHLGFLDLCGYRLELLDDYYLGSLSLRLPPWLLDGYSLGPLTWRCHLVQDGYHLGFLDLALPPWCRTVTALRPWFGVGRFVLDVVLPTLSWPWPSLGLTIAALRWTVPLIVLWPLLDG